METASRRRARKNRMPRNQHHERQAVPGDRVLQVVVRQARFQRPDLGAGLPARAAPPDRYRTARPRPSLSPPQSLPDRARTRGSSPASSFGVNIPRASGQRIAPTMSVMPRGCPSRRVPGSCFPSGTKPRLTMTRLPSGEPRGRKHPVARARHVGADRRAAGVDECFLIEKFRAQHHAAEFILHGRELWPALARRQVGRLGGQLARAPRSGSPSTPCVRAARCRAQRVPRPRRGRTRPE